MKYAVLALLFVLQTYGVYRSMYKDKGLKQKMLTSTAFLAAAAYALFSVKTAPDTFSTLIFCGIAASYLGDWLISYRVAGADGILGVVFFAAAHILYISAFLTKAPPVPKTLWLLLPLAAMLTAELFAKKKLKVNITGLMIPAILIYVLIINCMVLLGIRLGITCITGGGAVMTLRGIILIAGVIMFIVSDGGVCLNMFTKIRTAKIGGKVYDIDNFNIVTYNFGQFFIALSILI